MRDNLDTDRILNISFKNQFLFTLMLFQNPYMTNEPSTQERNRRNDTLQNGGRHELLNKFMLFLFFLRSKSIHVAS